MKCRSCDRGLTWRRIARDAAFDVGGDPYCGPCFESGRAPIAGPGGFELDICILLVRAQLDYRLHPDEGAWHARRWRPDAV